MKSREDFAFRRPDFGVERSVTTRVRYPDERFQELLDLTYGKVLQFLVSTARISDVADEYQGQKLQKKPGIHHSGIVDPQALHVQLILQVVETVLYNVFSPIHTKRFHRILDLVRQNAEKASITFPVLPDFILVEQHTPASFRSLPDDEVS